MKREIRFRGKKLDGKWICGAYVPALDDDSCDSIINAANPNGRIVKTDTVGQFTGLKDKNGVKIYEGDILKHNKFMEEYVCVWEEKFACIAFVENIEDGVIMFFQRLDEPDMQVMGNIHDNPEMLKN